MTILPREALQALRDKYAEMLEMRSAHEAGPEDVAEVRVRMAALASRFPGALREIDDLELAEIRRRIADLDATLLASGDPAPWMRAVAVFHAEARGALCAKRWLAGRRRVDPATREAYQAALLLLRFPEDAGRWTSDLDRVASPPTGRLTDLVWTRVAEELGVPVGEARRLVFGPSRRARST